MATTTKIRFGDNLTVTDEGAGTIRVDGATGVAGEGVPAGGTAGQVLTKDTATDYDTSWQTPAGGDGLPAGGSEGQHLVIQGGVPAWFGFTTYASLKAGVTSYADILA